MPKGVICAGALDGSNQAGAIVTCQAMTARPVGAGPSAAEAAVAKAKIPSDSRTAATRRRSPNTVIQLLPLDRCVCQRPSGRDCRPICGVPATALAPPSPPGEARPSLRYFVATAEGHL